MKNLFSPLTSFPPTLSITGRSVDAASFNGVFPTVFFPSFKAETGSLVKDFWDIFFAVFNDVVGSSLRSFCCFLALPDCWVTIGPFAIVFFCFILVDLEGTGEVSPIPSAASASFAGDFFCFFKMDVHSSSLAGLPATFSVVLAGLNKTFFVVLAGDALFAAAFFFFNRANWIAVALLSNGERVVLLDFVLDLQALVLLVFLVSAVGLGSPMTIFCQGLCYQWPSSLEDPSFSSSPPLLSKTIWD